MRITKYNVEVPNILVKEKSCNYESDNLTSPQIIVKLLNDVFRFNKQAEEYTYMLALDTKGKLLGVFEISHGTVDRSLISPREVYMRALLCGAKNIVIVHNHPSGVVHPSGQDRQVTEAIKNAGDIIGIKLLDHIIVGENDYYSFKEHGNEI